MSLYSARCDALSPVGCAQISLPARSPAGVSATPEKKQTLSRENLVRQGKERDKESAPCARLDNVVPMTAAPSSARALCRWDQQPERVKNLTRTVVKRKQLEFINGAPSVTHLIA